MKKHTIRNEKPEINVSVKFHSTVFRKLNEKANANYQTLSEVLRMLVKEWIKDMPDEIKENNV